MIALFAFAFVTKYVVLANLTAPAGDGWLRSMIENPAKETVTWLLELPIAMSLSPRRDLRLAVAVVVASLLTHPWVWLIATRLPRQHWWAGIFVVEGVVGVVEGVFVAKTCGLTRAQGLVVGVAMNAFSFGVGLCL